ncbi:MAG: hypothetical protein ACYCW6_17740 [Candidatus Xenobia bacterium]
MRKQLKKRLMQQSHAGEVTGLAWYEEAQYETLRAAVADPQTLPATWEGWQRQAERDLRDKAARGYHVHQVPVDVHALIAWAANRPLDAAARDSYVQQRLRETHHHMH